MGDKGKNHIEALKFMRQIKYCIKQKKSMLK